MAPRLGIPLTSELVAETPYLGCRIDFTVPLAVGEINDFDDLECMAAFAKRKEINKFNVERLYLSLDECREISLSSGHSQEKK